ncbi:sensor histidine kinase [Hanstruepera ponticola]|uniref:sensor histidine kinase n=1 Tax=Hanstruepera ponticola TaxID=2042995 RepID=UPI000CF178C3|nr:sensor histidine kinase [Hanstruepera ponticola]
MRKYVFFFLFILPLLTVGQKYSFKQFTTQDGLAHNSINEIIQAKDNRIWLATPGGLSSFNGKDFNNYNVNNGLSSNYINTVFEDSKGRIWIGTRAKGASIIHENSITNLTNLHPDGVLDIAAFLESKDGTIYMFSKDGFLTYKEGVLSKLEVENKSNTKIIHFNVTWFDENTIYIATLNYGIAKLTLNPAKIEFIDNNTHDLNNICYSVLKDGNALWVGTYGEMVSLESDKVTIKEKFNNTNYDQNRVYGIYPLNNQELLLAFEGNGFGIYNKLNKSCKIINQENGLPTPYIYKVIKDNEDNIWLATDGHGLIKYRDFSFKLYNTEVGFNSDEIIGVLPFDDEIMVATDQSLISLKDEKVNTIVDKPIYGISKAADDKMLFSTFDSIFRLNNENIPNLIKDGHFRHFYNDSIQSIFYRREHYEFLKENDFKIINHNNRNKYFLGIRALKNRYIFAHRNALLQFYKGQLKEIDIEDFEDSYFFGIDSYGENNIVLGDLNKEQLSFLSFTNDSISITNFPLSRFGKLDNLNTLKVNKDYLWLGTQKFLKKIDLNYLLQKDSVVSKNYFFNKDFFNASFKGDSNHNLEFTDNGLLVAASSDGLLLFDEEKYNYNITAPNINLNKVSVFSETLNDSLYRKNNVLELPYTSNYLTFNMEAITFSNPENVTYKYRLKGLRDSDLWSGDTNDDTVVYSYLPPGDYVFEFTASNGNGIWQENMYSYPFKIKAPFWRLPWFWIGFVLLNSLLALIIIVWRNKVQKEQLKRFSRDLIKAQEEERTRVSKDLHDSVGQQLTLIKKKAQNNKQEELSSLTNQALEEVRSISRALYPSNLKQLGLTESIEQLLYDLDEQTELFVSVDIDPINKLFNEEQSLNIYRFIQEAVNNVIKHAQAKSLEVVIEHKNQIVKLSVIDNGKGFDNIAALRQKSLGLKTMTERIRILGGEFHIISTLNNGTTIEVTIPV